MMALGYLLLSALAIVRVVFADPSAGCKEEEDGSRYVATKEFSFQDRNVLMSFPPGYKATKPATLIFAYHDANMTTKEMEKLTQFNHKGMNKDAIVVYPPALNGIWIVDPASTFTPKADSWDSDGDDPANDMFFTKDLLNHINDNYCVNQRRIYAAGMGQGGGMVHQLACHTHLSRRIAAFAAVGGAFYQTYDSKDRLWGHCMIGRRPIPIMEIHGDEDDKYPLVHQEKGASKKLLPASKWIRNWSGNNKCGDVQGEPTPSTLTNAVVLTQLDGGQMSESVTYAGGVIRTAYRCGWYPDRRDNDFSSEEKSLKRISVLQYVVKGFKHGWPRAQFVAEDVEFHGNTVKPPGSPYFDASPVILNFFRHHRLPAADVIMGQAKKLLIERGGIAYKQDGLPTLPRTDHGEL